MIVGGLSLARFERISMGLNESQADQSVAFSNP